MGFDCETPSTVYEKMPLEMSPKVNVAVPELVAEKERNLDAFVADVSARIARALVEAGPYEDEAKAMVDTWSRSYFRAPGLRILYVEAIGWRPVQKVLAVAIALAAAVLAFIFLVRLV